MIEYGDLRVENNKVMMTFQIEGQPYYSRVKIKGVRVDSPLTYGTEYPLAEDKLDEEHYRAIYSKSLKTSVYNLEKEFLIITPLVEKVMGPDAPCGADIVEQAVIYDKNVLIEQGLQYLKQLGGTCEVSREFIDYILRRYAFDMAIDTCNYDMAAKYWRMCTTTKGTVLKGCGCGK